MASGILIVWWVALIVALILALIILKLVFLIVQTERDILKLAHITLPAARGIDANTSLIVKLETTKTVAERILNASLGIKAGSESIAQKLQSTSRGPAQESV